MASAVQERCIYNFSEIALMCSHLEVKTGVIKIYLHFFQGCPIYPIGNGSTNR